MKKKTKRPPDASLKPNYNSKIRQEFLDYDYLNKLDKEIYDWLAAVTHEDNCANFNHPLPKVIKKTKKNTSEIYDKNNARNRDSFGATKAQNRLLYLEGGSPEFLDDYDISERNPEDALIEMIDNKNSEFKMNQLEIEFRRAKRLMTKRKKNKKKL